MPFDAQVLKVFIASPGDVKPLRDAIERELHEWNGEHADEYNLVFLPVRWEIDAVPGQGADGQTLINRQLVDEADILLGVFHARLGRPTPRAVSGTAEEIERMDAAGKPVHLYFSTAELPHNVDTDQLAGMRELKRQLQANGLTFDFDNVSELRRLVRRTMTNDARQVRLRRDTDSEPPRRDASSEARKPRIPLPDLEDVPADGDDFWAYLSYDLDNVAPASEHSLVLLLQNRMDVDVYGVRGTLRSRLDSGVQLSFELARLKAGGTQHLMLDYHRDLVDSVLDLNWQQDDGPGWHLDDNLPVRISNELRMREQLRWGRS